MGNRLRKRLKTYNHGGKRGEKRSGKCEKREGSRKHLCLRMQPGTASPQVPMNHDLAQTLLVAAHPTVPDLDHPCSLFWTEWWHQNSQFTILATDQLPDRPGLGCDRSWMHIFHFYHYWYLPPWDIPLSVWKILLRSSLKIIATEVWIVNMSEISNDLHQSGTPWKSCPQSSQG